MLADGTISLQVTSRTKEEIVCKALTAGTIRSRQGINLPGVTLSVSSMRPEDVENALMGGAPGYRFHQPQLCTFRCRCPFAEKSTRIAQLKRAGHRQNRKA